MAKEVKKRRRGYTRISRKNQVTLPAEVLRRTCLGPGDQLKVEPDGRGRIVLTAETDPIEKFIGDLTGVYEKGYLERLRSEWD